MTRDHAAFLVLLAFILSLFFLFFFALAVFIIPVYP